jgi:hypothetical protein
MVVAVTEFKGQAFRWNLSANVGRGQPNKIDDVELIRFGYACMRQNKKFPPDPELLPALRAMQNFGGFGPDLANVIVAHQKNRGGTQDGVVSVARISNTSTNRELYDGAHSWIVISLDNNMRDVAGDIYPRVDRHADSGPDVSNAIKRIFGVG